jgi:hypothetical protein
MRRTDALMKVEREVYYLLNQSPELYESRSMDLDLSISSPAWKKGIPWKDKLTNLRTLAQKFKL